MLGWNLGDLYMLGLRTTFQLEPNMRASAGVRSRNLLQLGITYVRFQALTAFLQVRHIVGVTPNADARPPSPSHDPNPRLDVDPIRCLR